MGALISTDRNLVSPDETPPEPSATKPISAGRASGIVVASGIAAVSAFLIQVLSARTLPVEENQEFLLYWSLVFGMTSVVVGMQNEATRAVAAVRASHDSDNQPLRRGRKTPTIIAGGLSWSGLVALGVVATSPWWAERLVPSTSPGVVAIAIVAVIGYGCHSTLLGALAGHREWGLFAGLMGNEALSRLILVAVAGIAFTGVLLPMEIAVALPFLSWAVFVLVSTRSRAALQSRSDVGLKQLLSNSGLAIVSSSATAALITGFPALLKLVSGHQDAALMASLILAISLTRSPIMIPLQAFQGVAISSFVESGNSSVRALTKPLGLLAGIGLAGGGVAWAVGPWLMRILFGSAYQLHGVVFAGLMIAAAALASLTLTGTAAIAVSQHRGYSAGWVSAALVSCALLFLPIDVRARAVVALFFGPLIGAIVHLMAISRHAGVTGVDPKLRT